MWSTYKPPPSTPIELDGQPVQVPDVLERPEAGKTPVLQRAMMVIMPVLIIGMLAWMISSGSMAQSPMMMMMPLSMIMMAAMMFNGSTGSITGEVAKKIRNWLLELREDRKQVHRQGKLMFQAQRTFFPQPQVLHTMVGHRPPGERAPGGVHVPRMWAIGHNRDAGLRIDDQGAAAGVTYNPYMAARIGIGTTLLDPKVEVNPQQVQENLEPVTFMSYRRFMRLQRFITGMPVGFDLKKSPYYQIDGDPEPTRALARAMVASLAFNHSPTELSIVLVTNDPDGEQWADMKWLPHVSERMATASGDVHRTIYRSLPEFWAASKELRDGRGMFMASSPAAMAGAPQARVLVVVDLPDSDDPAILPAELDARGIGDMTFLWLGRSPARLGVAEESTLYLDQQVSLRRRGVPGDPVTMISTGTALNIARADQMSLPEFRLLTHRLSGFRPVGWQTVGDFNDAHAAPEKVANYLEALGITMPIDEWDPLIGWKRRDQDRHTVTYVGNRLDEAGNKLPEIVELDIAEAAAGGSGPSGAAQGKTGAGKSFLLRGLVLTLAARYSPERLNFLLMDFKGGATFIGYEKLASVQAVLTNLEEEKHLLGRMEKVVRGEIERRQRLISKVAKVDSIDAYRALRVARPEMDLPALPNLMVVADEFREFIQNNREFLKLFESIAQVGRALGMHLLLVSQFIDESVIGQTRKNLTYGISLAVDDVSNSQTVIKSAAATDLKIGTGDAYLWREVPDDDRVKFRSFNVAEPYIAPKRSSMSSGDEPTRVSRAGLAAVRQAMERADGSAVMAFNAATGDRSLAAQQLGRHTAPAVADDVPAEVPSSEVAGGFDFRPTVEKVLLDRLVAEQSVAPPHTMWQPTMSRPLAFDEISRYAQDRSLADQMKMLELTIGILDDPAAHTQHAYTLILDGPGAHVRVAGDAGTGVTMTIEAIIAAAATQVGPAGAQFYIIDAGQTLSEMSGFPNVGGYTRASKDASDVERVERYMGEFRRIINIRQSAMQERGLSSFGAYWQAKQADPVGGDPYGHMFLVIDRANTFFAEDDDMRTRTTRIAEIITKGSSLGVHVIVGSSAQTMSFKIDPLFQSIIHHRMADMSTGSITYPSFELKEEGKLIAPEAGRVLDLGTALQGRIMMPHTVAYGPDPELTVDEANPKWSYRHDWRAEIEALGAELASATDERAPEIVTVMPELSPEMVWEVFSQMQRATPQARTMVPLGISAEDLSLITLADSTMDPTASGNLIIAGDRGTSGKTSTLRWLMRWIMETYRPGEAVVYLLDTNFQWMTEREMLRDRQLLGAYTADRATLNDLLVNITGLVESRKPSNPDEMTAKDIRERNWWTGPEIFIIADPGQGLMAGGAFGGGGAGDELCKVLSERNDLGARLWMSLGANELQGAVQGARPGMAALLAGNANVLLLSGSVNGTVFGSIGTDYAVRFERRRPGLGQLYNPQWTHYPIVQIPHQHPWE